jgi:hypothetical protein
MARTSQALCLIIPTAKVDTHSNQLAAWLVQCMLKKQGRWCANSIPDLNGTGQPPGAVRLTVDGLALTDDQGLKSNTEVGNFFKLGTLTPGLEKELTFRGRSRRISTGGSGFATLSSKREASTRVE